MPGYILIEANLVGDVPHRIRQIPNVFGFLEEKNNVPTPVRNSEINRILGVVDEMQDAEANLMTPFMKGESVKVVSGPFNGLRVSLRKLTTRRKNSKLWFWCLVGNSARTFFQPGRTGIIGSVTN